MAANSSSNSSRTHSRVISSPSSVMARVFTHCQIWDREISAVAASSMRLWIATAPLPRSQASM
jgi:hypothetical protein